MTSICFIHDSPLVEDPLSGKIYSQGFQYRIWQRYLRVFESMAVCTRMRKGKPSSGMGLSSGDGVTFYPATAYKGPLSFLFRLPTIYRQVAKAVSKTDAVVLRLPSILGVIGYFAAHRAGVPILVEVVGHARDSFAESGLLGRAIAPIASAITRYIVRDAPYCIYVTESYLQGLYPSQGQSAAISNVQLEVSKPPSDRYKPSGSLRIGSAGKIDVPYKGYDSVVSALVNLPGVQLEVAGGGDPSRLYLHAESLGVQDRVHSLGRLGQEDLFDWLDTLDLYIQPSLTEGLPRAVLEAMSCGLPVIASEVGGLPELLSPEFLFPAGNASAIADKIVELEKRNDLCAIGRTNYERAQDFDVSTLQQRRDKILTLFRDYIVENLK